MEKSKIYKIMDPLGYSTGKYGGSIREAGGGMGSMAAAREEAYFRHEDEKKFEAIREQMEKSKSENDKDQHKDYNH